MFWVFLAGLLEGSLVDRLLSEGLSDIPGERLDSWIWPYHGLQLYRCYAESLLAQSSTPSASVEKLLNHQRINFFLATLSVSDCAAIGTALQSHPQTERLHIVNYAGCRMTDSGLAQLLPGLQRCKSIKAFSLAGNDLSSQHMSAVSGVLANNASTLGNVSLSGNMIGDEGLEKLSGSLKRCRTLTKLWLEVLGLTSRGASTLSDALSSLPSLEQLSVIGNDLGDNGIAQLANRLQFCTRLRWLDIARTALSSQSVPILNRLLLSMPSVQLKVDRRDFTEEDKQKLLCGVSPKRVLFIDF